MPHVPGHIKNSFLRVGAPFPKKVGILCPIYHGDKLTTNWNGDRIPIPKNMVDFQILFVNDAESNLKYGQEVRFLIQRIVAIGDKHFCIATGVIPEADHEKADKEIEKYGPTSSLLSQAAKDFRAQENAYKKSESYDFIFKGNKIDDEESDRAIEWLIEHALSFDEMNLGTN